MWLSFSKNGIRDSNQISTTAPIFSGYNYFRQHIWAEYLVQFHFPISLNITSMFLTRAVLLVRQDQSRWERMAYKLITSMTLKRLLVFHQYSNSQCILLDFWEQWQQYKSIKHVGTSWTLLCKRQLRYLGRNNLEGKYFHISNCIFTMKGWTVRKIILRYFFYD